MGDHGSIYVTFSSFVGHWVHDNTHTNGVFCPFYSVPGDREDITFEHVPVLMYLVTYF